MRIASVYVWFDHPYIWGDTYYYHNAANLLVEGKGFLNPVQYLINHRVVQGADFPPIFTLFLAASSLVGFKSYFAHQIWSAILGAATVGMVGLAGREIVGRRVGLIAASIAAIYPNMWMNDPLVHSETLSMFMVASVLFVSFRLWHRPRLLTAGILGFTLGIAALARDELVLLVPLLLVPLSLLRRYQTIRLHWPQRLKMAGLGCLATALTIAPWTLFNLTRFQNPELVSTGLGVTLATANCKTTYYGEELGYWSLRCAWNVNPPANADESVQDAFDRKAALHYVSQHKGRAVVVVFARIGRTFALYQPIQQIRFDTYIETRPYPVGLAGLSMYYLLAPLALLGVVVLWRRQVMLLPFGMILLTNLFATVIAFGQTRYRAPTEVLVVVLAGVALDAVLSRRWRTPRGAHVRLPSLDLARVASTRSQVT